MVYFGYYESTACTSVDTVYKVQLEVDPDPESIAGFNLYHFILDVPKKKPSKWLEKKIRYR